MSNHEIIEANVVTREDTVPGFPMNLDQIEHRLNQIKAFAASQLNEDEDYGKVPGVQQKFMWQPGAQKICSAFGWGWRFVRVDERLYQFGSKDVNPDPTPAEAKQQSYYVRYRCELFDKRNDHVYFSREASCNSGEMKYRKQLGQVRGGMKKEKQLDPRTGKPIWDHSNCPPGNGVHKVNGKTTCRPKTKDVPGEEYVFAVGDLMHVIESMAQKRAFVATVVGAARLGYEFSYDEDLVEAFKEEEGHYQPKGDKPESEKPSEPKSSAGPKKGFGSKGKGKGKEEAAPKTSRSKGPPAEDNVDEVLDNQRDPKAVHPETGQALYSMNELTYAQWIGMEDEERKSGGHATMKQLKYLSSLMSKNDVSNDAFKDEIQERFACLWGWQLNRAAVSTLIDELSSS